MGKRSFQCSVFGFRLRQSITFGHASQRSVFIENRIVKTVLMRNRIGIALVVVLVLVGAGIAITFVMKVRSTQDRVYCQNNLRELSFFAETPDPKSKDEPVQFNRIIPAGTLPILDFSVDDRLSWAVATLPNLYQKRQDTLAIFQSIDQAERWNSKSNIPFAKQSIYMLECPGKPYVFDSEGWATTQYVGNGGVGDNAASLPIDNPHVGAFRYDQPTPFEAITDGRSTTFLFGEVAQNRGTWMQGGQTTVRTLNIAENAKPVLGPNGQFGGNHVNGAFFAYCDHSVRFMTEDVDPRILQSQMTIAGNEDNTLLDQ